MGLKISNASGDLPILELYGEIGDDFNGITTDAVRAALAELKDTQDIEVHVDTPGGSFRDSIAIFHAFSRRKGASHMVVDSEACSGGSLIVQAGKTITMLKGSWMMIHEAQGTLGGRASDFRAAAERLDGVNNQIIDIYKPRWKGSENDLRAAIGIELWMNEADAVARGLADKVGDTMAIAACADFSKFKYKNVPEVLVKKLPDSITERELELEKLIG